MKISHAVAVGLVMCCLAAGARAQRAAEGRDEAAIRAAAAKEAEGWANFDATEVASCYTADATWQNPFGVRIHSREQLQKFLVNLFARPGYRSAKDTMAAHITDVHILSPTSAVVWSEEKSAGQVDDATGKPMKPRYSHYLSVYVKRGGDWLVSDSLIMDEYPRE